MISKDNKFGKSSELRKRAEEISEAKRTERALKERIKELNFFFSLSDLLEIPDIRLNEILQKTVMLIPLAWQFPEIAESCIELDGQVIQSEHFRKTPWMQACNIAINRKTIGKVSVSYSEEPQTFDQYGGSCHNRSIESPELMGTFIKKGKEKKSC